MTARSSLRALAFALLAATLGGCAAPSSAGSHGSLLAQRRGGGGGGGSGGGTTCNADTDCHIRLPPPRACPNGSPMVPTACCRMNYCGICWSECTTGRSTGSASESLTAM